MKRKSRLEMRKQRWSDVKEVIILLKEFPIAFGVAFYLLLVGTLYANASVIWGLIF